MTKVGQAMEVFGNRKVFLIAIIIAITRSGVQAVYEYYYDNEFAYGGGNGVGRITCGDSLMTLQVAKEHIPRGMGFLIAATNDRVDTRSSPKCVNTGTEGRNLVYTLSLNCADVEFQSTDNTTIHRHEVHLGIVSKYYKEQLEGVLPVTLYTISLECAYINIGSSPKMLKDARFFVMEFRDESKYACYTSSCSYGGFCIAEKFIDGYKCNCNSKDHSCLEMTCPDGFHSCGVEDELAVCLPKDKICDGIKDCPNKADEICSEVWGPWGDWGTCDCATQVSNRRRSCKKQMEKLSLATEYACDDDIEEKSCVNMNCLNVICSSNTMSISIPRDGEMEEEMIRSVAKLNSNKIKDEDCLPTFNKTHIIFHIPLHLCGTSSWSDGQKIYYYNEITIPSTLDESSIIMRKLGHSFMGTCQYERESTIHLKDVQVSSDESSANWEGSVEMAALMIDHENAKELNEYSSSGDGEFMFKMMLYPDQTYRHPYQSHDYPLKKELGERIYAAVSVMSEDEDLRAVVQKCWATSGEVDANMERKQYVFIEDGCSSDATTVMVARQQQQTLAYDRFSLEAFRFVGETSPILYFRCDVIVCDLEENHSECLNRCNKTVNVRRRRSLNGGSPTIGHVQQGPIMVFDTFGVVGDLDNAPVSRYGLKTTDKAGKGFVLSFPLMAAIFATIGVICLLAGIGIGIAARKSRK